MEGPKSIAAGALGSRIAGRLTADLILRSPQYMNPVGDYQIDLRANKLGTIENLGATQNQFDSIDFSDNTIISLEGFPQLPRLKTLYLSNNNIIRIGRHLEESVPNIETLVLTNNRIKNLQDLIPLATLPRLQFLSLLGNEVTMKTDYRLFVIHRLKHLRHLDFRKIKPKERAEAEQRFGEAITSADGQPDKTFTPGEGLPEPKNSTQVEEAEQVTASKKQPSAQELTAIQAAIQNAQTLQEVADLENAIATGNVPSQFKEGNMNGTAEAMDKD